MPEGDTIFRTAASLRRWLVKRAVTRASTTVPSLDVSWLPGRTIEAVEPRGKHLLIRFDSGPALHTHMGMTGSWHVYPTGERWRKAPRHAAIVIEAGSRLAVCFSPPVVEWLSPAQERSHPSLGRLGPDVLVPATLDSIVIRRRARARAAASPTVGELLLDQQVVAGIGNIYRCETLFLGRVHPATPSLDLSGEQLEALVSTASRLMLANATIGSAIARSFDGPAKQTWVYRRSGRPCRRCGAIIQHAVHGRDARSVYWCPACQPRPAPAPA